MGCTVQCRQGAPSCLPATALSACRHPWSSSRLCIPPSRRSSWCVWGQSGTVPHPPSALSPTVSGICTSDFFFCQPRLWLALVPCSMAGTVAALYAVPRSFFAPVRSVAAFCSPGRAALCGCLSPHSAEPERGDSCATNSGREFRRARRHGPREWKHALGRKAEYGGPPDAAWGTTQLGLREALSHRAKRPSYPPAQS